MKSTVYVAGVDEAGRGPVIGPMVMCIFSCDDESLLGRLGVDDSKKLTPQKRQLIANVLRGKPDGTDYELMVLSPLEIDAAVLGKSSGDNLNKLEARTTAILLHRLAKRVPLSRVIIDSPTKTTSKYADELKAALSAIDPRGITKKIILQPEIKADAHHLTVGAASIIAKVTRDEAIESITKIHGPLGSGYPSDPMTQKFLRENWSAGHDFFRKSWETYQRFAKPAQPTLGDFGDDSAAESGKATEHKKTIEAFESLKEHGFDFVPPTNQYEIVRMKNRAGATVIAYTTGKVLIQGNVDSKTRAMIESLHPKAAEPGVKRGRTKKT